MPTPVEIQEMTEFGGKTIIPWLVRLCRNHDGGWIPTEQAVRFFSFRMRSFRVMGIRLSGKRDSFHGFGTPKLSNKRFPPCLRRSGYAQAGLKLHHPTACSVSKREEVLVHYDTISVAGGKDC